MSENISLPALKTFLALTPTPPKETSLPPSASRSPKLGNELPVTVSSPREHRGSSSSDSSVSSDVGEKGFLKLTPVEKGPGLENTGLNKIIEEEAVE